MRKLAAIVLLAGTAGLALAWLQSPAEGSRPSPSPLAAYPGFGHDAQADETRFAKEEAAREGLIAACMARKGLRYIPSPAVVVDGGASAEELLELAAADPNNRLLESLSPAEREEYSLALAGVPDANDPGAGPVGGCIGAAHRELPGVYAAFNALREPFEQLEEQIASDPRVQAAERRWSACMRTAGFALASPLELGASVEAALERQASGADTARSEAEFDRAVAAGAACDAEAGMQAAVASARTEHEPVFVERYRHVLERYRD